MSIQKLNPYLNFDGKAEQAIKLYERTLGAECDGIMRFSEMPGAKPDSEGANRVMHAELRVGGGVIMVSDAPPGMPSSPGGDVSVVLHFDDEADTEKKFQALAEGGKVTMPLADTFWAAKFGMLTDAYGIKWMFNCEKKKG
jgi:PhnB protein